ncbi:DUF1611 domain-containing protein [Lewinella sp. LCG006]|uniref:DUF1611 domain-containing protein n=1 Tax=Lewinella sp. LCG006 TaxID=3231911 RepID=UPI00345FFADA
MQQAIVLTNGMLATSNAKTCHGLLRGSERFKILAVIDETYAGQDAGVVLDGKVRNIPVVASVAAYFAQKEAVQPDACIVGVALTGGRLPHDFRAALLEAARHGCNLVNGLHTFLSDDPEFQQLANDQGIQLVDIRKPRSREQLQFWTGEIYEVKQPIVAVLGTDCALGKRTTTRWIMEALRAKGKSAEMIYTGQTGWLQGSPYGFVFDSTVNDFIGGELEKAVVNCAKEAKPDYILLEGQSSLRNPSGPCGSEYLLSANAKAVVLQHAPGREHFEGSDVAIGSIQKDIDLIRIYGSEVIAITLNGEELTTEELIAAQEALRKETGLPVVRPLEEGVGEVVNALEVWAAKR